MFKNRALQVSVINTKNNTATPIDAPVTMPTIDIDKLNNLVIEDAKLAAIGFVGIYTAVTFLKTVSEIAINIAPKR